MTHLKRRDLLAGGPAALLAATEAVAQSRPDTTRPRLPAQVDVRRDFGAIGDGIADDWAAIEAAGSHLERLGGGRMYFPTGKYRLANFARGITVRNNVEYYGDGQSSVIIGSNAAFISPQGAAFGRSSYHSYEYLPIREVEAGDQFIELRNAADVRKFKPGDIVIARSKSAIVTPGDVLPYYLEMNRVTRTEDNRLILEDAIDDGCTDLIAANVTRHIAQGYSIHDLRIECSAGYPIFIQGSYKSFIRNCWTRGAAVVCINAFTRSMAHNIIADVIWTAEATSASLFEVETGSVRANFHDIDVYLSGASQRGTQYPLFYCQEFSRRTLLRNIRVAAPGVDVGIVFQMMPGGHRVENIEVAAKSIDKVLDYVAADPAEYRLGHLGLMMSNVTVETHDGANGFNHGFILHNYYPGGEVQNVTIRDCVLQGAADQREHNLIWFLHGIQRNVTFDGVKGPGSITMNTTGLDPTGANGKLAYPLYDVVLRNCEYSHITSPPMLAHARFLSCERSFSRLPSIVRCPPGTVWSNSAPHSELIMTIPAHAIVCWGDCVWVELSVGYGAQTFPAHIQVRAMGATVATIDLVPGQAQDVDLRLRVDFVGGSFADPTGYSTSGRISVNNATLSNWKPFTSAFDRRRDNTIEVIAWIDKGAAVTAGMNARTGRISFRTAESGA